MEEMILPVVELKGRIKRLWFVDKKSFTAKRLDKYKGKLEKFDPNTYTVFDKKGNKLTVYATCKLATIAALKQKKQLKKEQWDELTNSIYKLNEEIGKITDEIEKLEEY